MSVYSRNVTHVNCCRPSRSPDPGNASNNISQPVDDNNKEMTDVSGGSTTDEKSMSSLDDFDNFENIDQPNGNAQSVTYPPIWSSKQAADFTSKYPWLLFYNGCLGCNTCKNVQSLGSYKSQGKKLSKEWCNISVKFNCDDRQDQLSSLRKKIRNHHKSVCHKAAEVILKKADEGLMESVVAKQKKHQYDSTIRVFLFEEKSTFF